jgi:hypothetical protein
MHPNLDLLTEARNRQGRNMVRLDMLDNSAVCATNDKRHPELAAQESIQIARQNPIGVRDDF